MAELATHRISEAISKALPFLRRYARAVTGSQKQGDEWVRLCAEVVLQQPELLAQAEDTKRGVFALFHRLQQPFGSLDPAAAENSVSGRLKESLTDMAPPQRQVLRNLDSRGQRGRKPCYYLGKRSRAPGG